MRSLPILACALALACTDQPPDARSEGVPAETAESASLHGGGAPASAARDVTIFFSRGESTAPVRRTAEGDPVPLEARLRELLAGPTDAERAAGVESWFSEATAGQLRSASVDSAGIATIDFHDLRTLIPNASSSAGSARLLRELNATVFEDARVRAIDYRIDGSCAAFWDWLQYGCQRVERPGRLVPVDGDALVPES